jgi:hypothetical protein
MNKLLVVFCVLFSVAFLATPVVAFSYFGLDHWGASIASSMVVGTLWIVFEMIQEEAPERETPKFLQDLFEKQPTLRSRIDAYINARAREISGFFGSSEVAEFLMSIIGAFLLSQLILRLAFVGFGPIEGWVLFTIILGLILIAVGVTAKVVRNRRSARIAAAEAAAQKAQEEKDLRQQRAVDEAAERERKLKHNAAFLQLYLGIAPEWFEGSYLPLQYGEVDVVGSIKAILTKRALEIKKLKAEMETLAAQKGLQGGKKKAAYDAAHTDFYKAALALQDINISANPGWEAYLPKEPAPEPQGSVGLELLGAVSALAGTGAQ